MMKRCFFIGALQWLLLVALLALSVYVPNGWDLLVFAAALGIAARAMHAKGRRAGLRTALAEIDRSAAAAD